MLDKSEARFKSGDRIFMVDKDEENVLEVNVLANRSNDESFGYDLVIVRVARGHYDTDAELGERISYDGLYGLIHTWTLTDRLQRELTP